MCAVSNTRIQDPTFIMTLRNPDATFVYCFASHVAGDSISSARVQIGVGIALSITTEHTFRQRFLGAVPSHGSVQAHSSWLDPHNLFVVSDYALTNRSSPEVKDQFYQANFVLSFVFTWFNSDCLHCCRSPVSQPRGVDHSDLQT